MCNRCGKCCNRGDFWQYSKHPLIMRLGAMIPAVNISHENQCLCFEAPNTCLIEKYLGKEAKPDICNQYDCKTNPDFKQKE